MTEKEKHAGNLDLRGGRLCLDFANTVDYHGRERPKEYLNTFKDLIAWSLHLNILRNYEAKKLSRVAEMHPSKAKMVLNRAIELREAIYRIFSSIFEGKRAKGEDLALLNENLYKTMSNSLIIQTKSSFFWDSNGNKEALDWILNPVIRSAAELLVSEELKRVRKCADQECGWLFLDISRNKNRRWCDMKDCGNRAKASRFYKRKKKIGSN